jgi:2-methylisocitrate lyase-like PEP mutase family enzyme
MATVEEKRAAFRALHAQGCFALPNAWDVGSAKLLQHMGFKAIASTSSGFAWTQGRSDYGVTREAALAHLAALSAGVDVPVNADFEAGFADDADGVGESVRLALEAGVAGLSIEDFDAQRGKLFDEPTARARIVAARRAVDAAGGDAILVARAETLLHVPDTLTAAIDRLVAFAALGADCLYAPGVRRREDIATMVRAVAPKPLNVLALDPAITLAEYADLGVRRVSVGGALARVGWAAVLTAAREISQGSFAGLAAGASSKEVQAAFAKPGA